MNYSDGSSATVTAQVSGVLNDFATGLSPSATSDTSLTPGFSLVAPPNAAAYLYQFSLMDSQGNGLWQFPGGASSSDGFSSAITSIPWGTDPTGGGSQPAIPALSPGATYLWEVEAIDSNGNSTIQRTYYQP